MRKGKRTYCGDATVPELPRISALRLEAGGRPYGYMVGSIMFPDFDTAWKYAIGSASFVQAWRGR